MIDELRRLLAEATPGPWVAPSHAPEDRIVPKGMDLHAARDSGPDWPGFFLGAVEEKSDAALIVAAVNALPALLDVVEAAQRWNSQHAVYEEAVEDADRLVAALAALEEK